MRKTKQIKRKEIIFELDEWARIEREARSLSMTTSEYIRRMILNGKVVQVNGPPVLSMPIQVVPAIQFIMDLKNKTGIDTVQNILISVAVKLIGDQICTVLSLYEMGRIKVQKNIRFALRDPDEVFRQHTSRFQPILIPQLKPEPHPLEVHIGMDREKKILWFGFGEDKGRRCREGQICHFKALVGTQNSVIRPVFFCVMIGGREFLF